MSAAPSPGGTLAAVLDRAAAAVAAAVPGLDAGGARVLVAEAASRRGALRQLDRHLAAFPGALASRSADAPKAVIALAGLLAAAGYPGIVAATCLACGRLGELPHRSGEGRLCRNCYRQRRQEPCRRCGRTRRVHARTDAGPLCSTCSSRLRPSGGCGLDRPVRLRAAGDQPDLCRRCAARAPATCAACGQQGRCDTPDGPPVCMICRTWPAHECRSCGQARPVMAW